MKNVYIAPVTETTKIEISSFVCASPVYRLSRYAEWGDEGTYAPSEWVNEKKPTESLPGYPKVTVIMDDPDDLPSRSKGGLWTDDD